MNIKKVLFLTTGDKNYPSKVRKIILVPESVIIHKEECPRPDKRKKFLWKVSTVPRVDIGQYWRIYYSFRNLIYLGKKYQINKIKFLYDLVTLVSKTIIGVILYDDYKLARIKLIVKAIKDGFLENLGKNISPAIWNKKFSQK